MANIVKFALREIVLNENLNLSTFTKQEALDELIRIEREEVQNLNAGCQTITADQMHSFREHRKSNHRIATVKMIRSVLNLGLSEALILVKGIESQDNILT